MFVCIGEDARPVEEIARHSFGFMCRLLSTACCAFKSVGGDDEMDPAVCMVSSDLT